MSSRSRRTSHSVALTRLAQVSALALAATLVGCQSTHQLDEADSVRAHSQQARIKPRPAPLLVKPVEQAPRDVWERMRQGFVLQEYRDVNPRIDQQRLWFASNPTFIESAGERGSLYLHYIVERLEERG
ncbi:MAG TPA: lytic transglycosylase, partial [Pseudomonas sp.]|nr:lytic transglycosylase [Pseudomonas sp.]